MAFHSRPDSARVPVRLRSAAGHLFRLPLAVPIGREIYRRIGRRCERALGEVTGVARVALHGGAVSDCRPAISDLDYAIFLEALPPADHARAIEELGARYRKLVRRYRIPGEILLFSPRTERLLRDAPTPLGWELGMSGPPCPEARIGLFLQYYVQALEALRLAIRHGETSFYVPFFARRLEKAARALGCDALSDGGAAERLASLVTAGERAAAACGARKRIPRREHPPIEAALAGAWRDAFRAFGGPDGETHGLTVVFESDDWAGFFDRFVAFLVGKPEWLRVPAVPLPVGLFGLLNAGWSGWTLCPPAARDPRSGSLRAAVERLAMRLPVVAGALAHRSPALARPLVDGLTLDLHALARLLSPPGEGARLAPDAARDWPFLEEKAATTIGACLSPPGFDDTIGSEHSGNHGRRALPDS